MNEKKIVLTYEGLKKLEDELQDLKISRRKDVAEKIKEARGHGDLSENAEYDAAKEEQAEIEARIITLEKMLRNAEVIDEGEIDKANVSVGCKITILDVEYKDKLVFTLVGSAEADPSSGRISNESPLGKGLIGHTIGETVDIDAPQGVLKYKILEIN